MWKTLQKLPVVRNRIANDYIIDDSYKIAQCSVVKILFWQISKSFRRTVKMVSAHSTILR